jgi:hypothetical protein
MFKLKAPLNYKGKIYDSGTTANFLPEDFKKKLIASGAGENVAEETVAAEEESENDINLATMKKDELLDYAAKLNIEGISEENTKAEIIIAIKEQQKSGE